MEQKVLCKNCGRLLGVVRRGVFENKHGKQIIRAERAEVVCPKCGAVTRTPEEKKAV